MKFEVYKYMENVTLLLYTFNFYNYIVSLVSKENYGEIWGFDRQLNVKIQLRKYRQHRAWLVK